MTKVRIDRDKLSPYHYLVDEDDDTAKDVGWEVEVEQDTVLRWERIEQEFDHMQREMADALTAASEHKGN